MNTINGYMVVDNGWCTDPEVTIGDINDLHTFIHNLEIVDQAWQQERRRQAILDNYQPK